MCGFDLRGLAASDVSEYSAVSVFRVVATEGGNAKCAVQRSCGAWVGRAVIVDMFCWVCIRLNG